MKDVSYFNKICDIAERKFISPRIVHQSSSVVGGTNYVHKIENIDDSTTQWCVYNEDGRFFEGDLGVQEIEILATYMKCEWLNRSILTWENVKPEYVERDFSKANLIDKLNNTLTEERKEARRLEAIYYRSVDGKPFNFKKLAGGN